MPTYKVVSDKFWYGEFYSHGDTFETEEYIYADGVQLIDDLPTTRLVLANYKGTLTAGTSEEITINWKENEFGLVFLAVQGEIKFIFNGNETAYLKDCNLVYKISSDMVRKIKIEAVSNAAVYLSVLREAR